MDKEVYFYEYCKTCKYQNKSKTDEPCNDCLSIPTNTDSHKPVNWEEK